MLNKRICKYCWATVSDLGVNNKFRWDKRDKERWKKKIIICPVDYSGTVTRVSITEDPPSWCPYALEHVLENDK